MLHWRLMAAICILTPLVLLIWLDHHYHFGHPGIWLAPLVLLISAAACWEVTDLLQAGQIPVSPAAAQAGTLLVVAMALMPVAWRHYPVDCPVGKPGWVMLGFAAAVGIVVVAEMIRFQQPGGSIIRMATAVFTISYVGVLISFLVQLRLVGTAQIGLPALVVTILVTKMSDTGAYFTGRRWGRHKLIPRLSPGKTIEGALGGLLAAALTAWFGLRHLVPWWTGDLRWQELSLLPILGFGITLAVAGMLGDLAESLLKRDVQRKDSSHWLPGLGGVLDILDSLLVAAPASFAWWVSGLFPVDALTSGS